MTRNVRLVFWAAGAVVVALAVMFGPLWAGYALAGVALGVIAVLMGMSVVHAAENWRLEHPFRFGRKRANVRIERDEERRRAA
jgi:hypothetical protein